jgi:hypothetical protein
LIVRVDLPFSTALRPRGRPPVELEGGRPPDLDQPSDLEVDLVEIPTNDPEVDLIDRPSTLSTAGLCSDDVCGVWRNVTVPFSGVAKSAGFSSDQFFILIVNDLVIDLAQPTKRPMKSPVKAVCRTRRKGNMKRCTKYNAVGLLKWKM